MKTKKLIQLLQEEDPSGELECCVGNVDIYFVSKEPAYYDGRQEILVRDEANPYYNVTGAKITGRGDKIQFHLLSIDDAIWNDPELPVDLSECSDNGGRYATAVETWREAARQGKIEVEKWAKENGIPKDGKGLVPMKSIWGKAWDFISNKNK